MLLAVGCPTWPEGPARFPSIGTNDSGAPLATGNTLCWLCISFLEDTCSAEEACGVLSMRSSGFDRNGEGGGGVFSILGRIGNGGAGWDADGEQMSMVLTAV